MTAHPEKLLHLNDMASGQEPVRVAVVDAICLEGIAGNGLRDEYLAVGSRVRMRSHKEFQELPSESDRVHRQDRAVLAVAVALGIEGLKVCPRCSKQADMLARGSTSVHYAVCASAMCLRRWSPLCTHQSSLKVVRPVDEKYTSTRWRVTSL